MAALYLSITIWFTNLVRHSVNCGFDIYLSIYLSVYLSIYLSILSILSIAIAIVNELSKHKQKWVGTIPHVPWPLSCTCGASPLKVMLLAWKVNQAGKASPWGDKDFSREKCCINGHYMCIIYIYTYSIDWYIYIHNVSYKLQCIYIIVYIYTYTLCNICTHTEHILQYTMVIHLGLQNN